MNNLTQEEMQRMQRGNTLGVSPTQTEMQRMQPQNPVGSAITQREMEKIQAINAFGSANTEEEMQKMQQMQLMQQMRDNTGASSTDRELLALQLMRGRS